MVDGSRVYGLSGIQTCKLFMKILHHVTNQLFQHHAQSLSLVINSATQPAVYHYVLVQRFISDLGRNFCSVLTSVDVNLLLEQNLFCLLCGK